MGWPREEGANPTVFESPYLGRWDGISEDGRVLVLFRDLVRKLDPFAHAWIDGNGEHRIRSGKKDEQGLGDWPWYDHSDEGARTEARAWSDAYLSLVDAGLATGNKK